MWAVPRDDRRRVLGWCAVAGPVLFTVASFVAWSVQDEYSARREDISALAAIDAQHAWIMIVGIIALGLGLIALGLGLANAIHDGASAKVGPLLLVLAGLSFAAAGPARNDCSSELQACKERVAAGEVSWHHTVHDVVGVAAFLPLIIAPFVLARAFFGRIAVGAISDATRSSLSACVRATSRGSRRGRGAGPGSSSVSCSQCYCSGSPCSGRASHGAPELRQVPTSAKPVLRSLRVCYVGARVVCRTCAKRVPTAPANALSSAAQQCGRRETPAEPCGFASSGVGVASFRVDRVARPVTPEVAGSESPVAPAPKALLTRGFSYQRMCE